MKNKKAYLKINEVSKLYNIGVDSLRYYEDIGLLIPSRGAENNYRYYGYEDLMKLNLIRELRKLNFSFIQIKEMLGHRNLRSTLELLNRELSLIDLEIRKMQDSRHAVLQRIHSLETAISDITYNQISVRSMPERKCLHIVYDDVTIDEIDYYISTFIKEHGIHLEDMIGRSDGYRLDIHKACSPERYAVKEVFILNKYLSMEPSFILPAGEYLSVAYNGRISKSRIWGEKMLKYAEENHILTEGDMFEFCVIDYYETDVPEEYITLLQIKIKHSGPCPLEAP